jgi:AcrR family transcriptional regulator
MGYGRAVTVPGQARRRYDASGRRQRAQDNRDRVLAAARRLFVADGYPAVSITRIAAEAGVSSRTVFGMFASKAGLLKEVLDVAVAGDADAVPLHERPAMRAVHTSRTAAEAVERLADAFAEVAARSHEVWTVVHGAAAVDPEIAQLERALGEQRLTGAGFIAATIADRLGLTDPDAVERLRDAVWVLGAPQQYGLVRERGWSDRRYRDWAARTLAATLLDGGG